MTTAKPFYQMRPFSPIENKYKRVPKPSRLHGSFITREPERKKREWGCQNVIQKKPATDTPTRDKGRKRARKRTYYDQLITQNILIYTDKRFRI